MEVLFLGALALSGPLALWLTLPLCRGAFRAALADREPLLPAFVEGLLPLRGRWLRYFFTMPALCVGLTMVFACTWLFVAAVFFIPLLIVRVIFGPQY
ncbi:MAG TPA: hypothetical protein VFU47_10295 [Armatimonadota bacterium]|nr:hypothetical protein [Armatimonadota bacterium]